MGIKTVTYREARLVSTAQYENVRFEIEATSTVDENTSGAQAFVNTKNFVKECMRERVVEHFDKKKVDEQNRTAERIINKYNL